MNCEKMTSNVTVTFREMVGLGIARKAIGLIFVLVVDTFPMVAVVSSDGAAPESFLRAAPVPSSSGAEGETVGDVGGGGGGARVTTMERGDEMLWTVAPEAAAAGRGRMDL